MQYGFSALVSRTSLRGETGGGVPAGGGGGVLLVILGGGVPPGSPNPDPISDQKLHSSHPFLDLASIHTHSQTWPLRNYVLIT